MLNITERSPEELITLRHGTSVFHEALSHIKEGETRFHVTDETGRVPDYDLVYTANMLLFPEHVRNLILKMTNGGATYGSFLSYEEENVDTLCLDFFNQYEKIELESADEYSIVFARMALLHTDLPLFFTDERFLWFLEDSDRLHLVDMLPEEHDPSALRVTPSVFDMGYTKRDWTVLGSVAAFQNVFFWQHFIGDKKGPFSYVEIVLSEITGIGGVLSNMSIQSRVAQQMGYRAYLKPGCTRYPEALLCRYFHIDPKPADATEENTIFVDDLAIISTTWFSCQFPANFDESILDEGFASEMSEYAQAIIGGKKTLGVLARGTDYVTTNLGDDRVHAKPAHMIPMMREWMKEGGYEKIFLATEDKDIYDAMLAEFPGQVVVIAQERHSVSEMKEKNSTLIYEFEREINAGKAYDDALEDTTVNYFYALYILAQCDAFMCSGQCNGWDVVRSFNKGRFEKEYKFAVGLDKSGGGRAVGGPILSGKTFMYSESSYRTTGIRYILKDAVDKELLQSAVDQALPAHPWITYGIYEQDGSFYYHNELLRSLTVYEHDWEDLPEIGGKDMDGHLAAVFFKDRTITFAVFHGLTDGKGIITFADEVLKAYAANLRGETYVAEIVEHPDINAEPFEAAGQMYEKLKLPPIPKDGKGFMDKEPFLIPGGFEDENSTPAHIMLRADAAEYMSFAKKLGVRPVAVLVSLYAKAVLRVMGDTDRKMKIAVPVDFRDALEIPHTFRNCAMPPVMIELSPELANGPIEQIATAIQGVMDQRTSKPAGVMAVKALADMLGQMPALPFKEAFAMFANLSGGPIFSFNASYAYRLPQTDYLSLLDGVYIMYPSTVAQNVLEMAALPDAFCICLNQSGETTAYADAFCAVCKENGISCRTEGTLLGNTGYVALREYENWN